MSPGTWFVMSNAEPFPRVSNWRRGSMLPKDKRLAHDDATGLPINCWPEYLENSAYEGIC